MSLLSHNNFKLVSILNFKSLKFLNQMFSIWIITDHWNKPITRSNLFVDFVSQIVNWSYYSNTKGIMLDDNITVSFFHNNFNFKFPTFSQLIHLICSIYKCLLKEAVTRIHSFRITEVKETRKFVYILHISSEVERRLSHKTFTLQHYSKIVQHFPNEQ